MRRSAAACAALLLLPAWGCAGGGVPAGLRPTGGDREPISGPSRVVPPPAPRRVTIQLPDRARGAAQDPDYGPDVLDPPTPAVDAVVAQVGEVEIRKSQVFDRMLLDARRQARTWVDVAVGDVVVAEMARRYDIHVDRERIDELAEEQEELLLTEVDLTGRFTLEEYVRRLFDLDLDEYRTAVRRNVAMVRYRGLVIRYLALLEDRVEARFMVHSDPAVLREARQKVLDGADFAALARQLSEDRSKAEGGYLAPFGRAFRHPVARTAFELEVGEVSPPFALPPDQERHAIVYCLRRLPRRDVPFEEVREELAQELDTRPITPFEQNAFVLQYCRSTEELPGGQQGR